jgi:predicted porin
MSWTSCLTRPVRICFKQALCVAVFLNVSLVQAQPTSELKLYGLLDVGVYHITGLRGGSLTQLASGIMEGSRWGLTGREDLGGGFATLFQLESRFETDTGALSNRPSTGSQLPDRLSVATLMGLPAALQPVVSRVAASLGAMVGANHIDRNLFDRQAYLGLVTPVGAFLAGRLYTPAYEAHFTFDAMRTESSLASGQLIAMPVAFSIRANNALAYRIEHSGFTGMLMYGFGEEPGGSDRRRFLGAVGIYKNDRLAAGAGYNQLTNELGEKSLRSLVAGVRVDVGPGALHLMGMKFDDDHPTGMSTLTSALVTGGLPAAAAGLVQNAFTQALIQDSRVLHIGYRFHTGAHQVTVAFNRKDDRRPANADTDSYGAAYTYALSKRTDASFVVTHYNNKGLGQAAPGGNGFLGGVTASAGKDSNNVTLSLRHRF